MYLKCPQRFNFPQLMLAIDCQTKHVPKSIRETLATKSQCIPRTTTGRVLAAIRRNGVHEQRIVQLLLKHGLPGEPPVFFRGDNYQRLYQAVASASARDATKDTAHVVFTSAMKKGI